MTLGSYLKELRNNAGLSQRSLEKLSGISNAEISRMETGERKNPSPMSLKAIAPHLGVSYEELLEKAGYINNQEDLSSLHKYNNVQMFEEKFIEIITPKLIKEGWAVEPCPPSSIGDILAKKSEIKWNLYFKYIEDSPKTSFITREILFNTYGKLAVYDGNQITKFTVVTNNQNSYSIFVKFAPINLKIKISIMLVDFESNKILQEIDIN